MRPTELTNQEGTSLEYSHRKDPPVVAPRAPRGRRRRPVQDAPKVVIPKYGDELSCGQALDLLGNVLRFGGFCLTPSDCGFALTALPAAAQAIKVLDEILDHHNDPIPLTVASIAMATETVSLNYMHERVLAPFWPGALTLVAVATRKARDLPRRLHVEDGTLGLRVSRSRIERGLVAEAYMPLTSAAVRDENGDIIRDYAEAVDLVWRRIHLKQLTGFTWAAIKGDGRFTQPSHSTVIRVGPGGNLSIIRPGALTREEIAPLLFRPSMHEYAEAT